MAYLVYIVRQNDYTDALGESTISLQEWLDYGGNDPELQPALKIEPPFLDVEHLMASDQSENETGDFDWYGHPRSDADTIPAFFFYSNSIATKYPDNHTIGKMIKIASTMNARVKNDDGEYYDETFFTNGGYPIGT